MKALEGLVDGVLVLSIILVLMSIRRERVHPIVWNITACVDTPQN